jgi:hypothetical protein
VKLNKLLQPVIEQALQQIVDQCPKEILIVHDTTEVCPTSQSIRAAQVFPPLERKTKHGFLAHASLVVGSGRDRNIFGLLGLHVWTRKRLKPKKRNRKNTNLPDSHETFRWGNQVKVVEELAGNLRQKFIHVMDRDADAYWIFCQLKRSQGRFVIRLHHDRTVEEETEIKLFELFRTTYPDKITRSVYLSKRIKRKNAPLKNSKRHPPRKARIAQLTCHAKNVCIKRGNHNTSFKSQPKLLPEINVNVVHVYEPDPPKGEIPVEWFLVTSEPIETDQQIERIVDFYRNRWVIEEFFKALKYGCRLEGRFFGEINTWYKILALFIPIACQIYNLRNLHLNSLIRNSFPILTKTQWKILEQRALREGRDMVTIADAKLEIANLGGHIKYAGLPGWLVLARGFEQLLLLEQGWLASKHLTPSDK